MRKARVESLYIAGLDHFWFLFFKLVFGHWLGGGATPTNESDSQSPNPAMRRDSTLAVLNTYACSKPPTPRMREESRFHHRGDKSAEGEGRRMGRTQKGMDLRTLPNSRTPLSTVLHSKVNLSCAFLGISQVAHNCTRERNNVCKSC